MADRIAAGKKKIAARTRPTEKKTREPFFPGAETESAWLEVMEKASLRNHYFNGKLLGKDDLEREQDYHRSKKRLENRFVVGWGVVSGLDVAEEKGRGSGGSRRVTVSPGMAIDPWGRELVLASPVSLTVPFTGNAKSSEKWHLVLSQEEKKEAPMPSPTEEAGDYSVIREGCRIEALPGPAPQFLQTTAMKGQALDADLLDKLVKGRFTLGEFSGSGVLIAELTVKARAVAAETSVRRIVLSPRLLQEILPVLFPRLFRAKTRRKKS